MSCFETRAAPPARAAGLGRGHRLAGDPDRPTGDATHKTHRRAREGGPASAGLRAPRRTWLLFDALAVMSADTVGAPVVAADCMTCIDTLIRVSSEPNQHADAYAYVREEACLFLDARERSEGRILWRVSDNSARRQGKS